MITSSDECKTLPESVSWDVAHFSWSCGAKHWAVPIMRLGKSLRSSLALHVLLGILGGFHSHGGSQTWMVFLGENPTKTDDLGLPLFQEPPWYGYPMISPSPKRPLLRSLLTTGQPNQLGSPRAPHLVDVSHDSLISSILGINSPRSKKMRPRDAENPLPVYWKHLVITGLGSRKITHYMETMLCCHPNI